MLYSAGYSYTIIQPSLVSPLTTVLHNRQGTTEILILIHLLFNKKFEVKRYKLGSTHKQVQLIYCKFPFTGART